MELSEAALDLVPGCKIRDLEDNLVYGVIQRNAQSMISYLALDCIWSVVVQLTQAIDCWRPIS